MSCRSFVPFLFVSPDRNPGWSGPLHTSHPRIHLKQICCLCFWWLVFAGPLKAPATRIQMSLYCYRHLHTTKLFDHQFSDNINVNPNEKLIYFKFVTLLVYSDLSWNLLLCCFQNLGWFASFHINFQNKTPNNRYQRYNPGWTLTVLKLLLIIPMNMSFFFRCRKPFSLNPFGLRSLIDGF